MDDTCVMCGEIIPEGIMVCPICEMKILNDDDRDVSGLLTDD